MNLIKPPNTITYLHFPSIFLAGSIEMGRAIDWQANVQKMFEGEDINVLSPRRDNWDWSTKQSIHNKTFKEQVTWELDHLERADYVLFNFDPNTRSPISLLELGAIGTRFPEKCLVVCPDGFWRKGNVDIVCERYGIQQFDTLEEAVQKVKEDL